VVSSATSADFNLLRSITIVFYFTTLYGLSPAFCQGL
jgi:hypothetical protein